MKKFSKISILICTHVHMGLHNKSCGGGLSLELVTKLKQQIMEQELDITVREQACFGRCEEGIVAGVYPEKDYLMGVTEHSLIELIDMAKHRIEKEAP